MFATEASVISPTQDPATVKRRLAFQKSYSQEVSKRNVTLLKYTVMYKTTVM